LIVFVIAFSINAHCAIVTAVSKTYVASG